MPSIPQLIIVEAQRQGVDPALALEVANVESGFNQSARGSHGEIGVFQLMPATAIELGVDPTDLNQNIQGGVSYLRQMLAQFGDPTVALAAYNWGPGNVQQSMSTYGTSWLTNAPASVQQYVSTVLNNVATQYSVVTAFTAAQAGASAGGSTSTMTIPAGLQVQPGPAPAPGFSWGAVALVVGVILGIGLVLYEL